MKAVCYLNSHGKDFNGGIFHFKDGEPSYIVPNAGVSESVPLSCIADMLRVQEKYLMDGKLIVISFGMPKGRVNVYSRQSQHSFR